MSNKRMKNRAVVAVLIPREHLPFIRDWCLHHISQGWKVFIYDNTGSVGSSRASSIFSTGVLQKSGIDKRGVDYRAYTKGLSDEEVSELMRSLLEDLDVTIIPWQPRNADGCIVHGQVEAYVDFIHCYRREVNWAAFIDADEYLETGAGMSWDALISVASNRDHYRLVLNGIGFERRWTLNGEPRKLDTLQCAGIQKAGTIYLGCKNIVCLEKVIEADIHWYWRIGERGYVGFSVDPAQFFFKHYNVNYVEIRLDEVEYLVGEQPIESISIY